jgi:phage shock protein A
VIQLEENCGASSETVGKHEEKLKNLEHGQGVLQENISEVKSDLKELINLIKFSFEQNQKALSERMDKLENKIEKIMWNAIKGFGILGFAVAVWYFTKLSNHIMN